MLNIVFQDINWNDALVMIIEHGLIEFMQENLVPHFERDDLSYHARSGM